MRTRKTFLTGAFLSLLLLFGCASQKPVVVNFPIRAETTGNGAGSPQSQPPAEVITPSKAQTPSQSSASTPPSPPASSSDNNSPVPQTIPVPVTDYKAPDNTPPEPAAPQSDKDIQTLVAVNNLRFEIKPEQDDYHGGAVCYNYIPNHVYQLFVAPLQLTTIILEPSEETVTAPAAGDTANFMVGSTYSIEGGQEVHKVLVKAVYAGKQTTLLVSTNKRSYFFHVVSYESIYMPLVSFNYPLDFAEKMQKEVEESQNKIVMFGKITDLDFAYTIVPHSIHMPSWMPDRVFNDGVKTYISFPSASRAGYAPVLFEVNDKNERTLVPYHVISHFYIADHVLRHFELVLDVNEGNIISVVHKED
jgi:type IV secretion system protein VirB9